MRGSCGYVFPAIKSPCVARMTCITSDAEMLLRREQAVWQTVSGHPNVLPLHVSDLYVHNDLCMLRTVAPLCVPLTCVPEHWLGVVRDISRGLRHLHDNGIVHCDVKVDNVLQMQDGRYVLSDFGSARSVVPVQPPIVQPITNVHTRAPEGTRLTKSYDVWSLALLALELAIGMPPFMVSMQMSMHNHYDASVYAMLLLATDAPDAVCDVYPNMANCDKMATLLHTSLRLDPDSRASIADVEALLA